MGKNVIFSNPQMLIASIPFHHSQSVVMNNAMLNGFIKAYSTYSLRVFNTVSMIGAM